MYVAGLAWTLCVWVGGFCARQFLNVVATPSLPSLPSLTPPPLMSTRWLRSRVHTLPYYKLDKVLACARLVGAGVAPALGRLVMPLSFSAWGFLRSGCGGYDPPLQPSPGAPSQPPWPRKDTSWIDEGKED